MGKVTGFLEIERQDRSYKPASDRQFGYYCMPILSGERLLGRVDLKADRNAGTLRTVQLHFERPVLLL